MIEKEKVNEALAGIQNQIAISMLAGKEENAYVWKWAFQIVLEEFKCGNYEPQDGELPETGLDGVLNKDGYLMPNDLVIQQLVRYLKGFWHDLYHNHRDNGEEHCGYWKNNSEEDCNCSNMKKKREVQNYVAQYTDYTGWFI